MQSASGARPMPNQGVQSLRCDHCGTEFELRFVFQRFAIGDRTWHACTQACRQALQAKLSQQEVVATQGPVVAQPMVEAAPAGVQPVRLAVLNQKGGTGKTTTSVNLAAGLAAEGKRVLLIDVDAQGHVGVSLGVRGPYTLYHILTGERAPAECVVEALPNLHLITANETLAAAEITLARQDTGRDQVLARRMASLRGYDYVLFDCGPSLSLLNMNVLTYAGELLVPVSCDYLSLVGVRQIVKTVGNINELLGHPVGILGVLPTFYDQRNRISDEAVKTLKAYFRDLVLPPIRVNTQLKEAPSHQKSIFQYAPDSRGAEDYRRLVQWIRQNTESTSRRSDAKQA
jgi:chromosome partitioning protein